MVYSSTIKKRSKNLLRGRWPTAVGVFLTPLILMAAITFVMGYIIWVLWQSGGHSFEDRFSTLTEFIKSYWPIVLCGIIYIVFMLLLVVPISLGSTRWYSHLSSGRNSNYNEIFYFSKSPSRTLKAVGNLFNLGLRKLGWFLLFSLFPGIVWGVEFYIVSRNIDRIVGDAATNILFFIVAVVLMITSIVIVYLFAVFVNRYFLTNYLIGYYNKISLCGAARSSLINMKGYKAKLFWLRFSFLGWMLISIVIFPILLYTIPYYNTSMAVYAQHVLEAVGEKKKPIIHVDFDFLEAGRNP